MSDILSVYVWPFAAAVLSYILCVYVVSKRRLVFDTEKNRLFKAISSHLQGEQKEKTLSLLLILAAMVMFDRKC